MKMTNQFENPWEELAVSPSPDYFTSRKVSKDINFMELPIQWAVSSQGRKTLLVQYDESEDSNTALPNLKGLRIGENKQQHILVLELLDDSMSDAFLKVCLDIIETMQLSGASERRFACILRLEKWEYFFKEERHGLGFKAQKGLIAELVCLKEIVIPRFNSRLALQSWKGPEKGVHDFVFGETAIEVKSNQGASTPNVMISSASQLSVDDSETLFLYVEPVIPGASDKALSLTGYVEEVRKLITSPLDNFEFDRKLAAVGYFDSDDYSPTKWSCGEPRIFSISADFPKIDEEYLNPAIQNITYTVNLDYCSKFEVEKESFYQSIGELNV